MNTMTQLYLLNAPLENDYKHTLYFENLEAQYNYFYSKRQRVFTNFSYQRKDSFIRVPAHFDTLQNVNYVMYQNPTYSNKWFYAFITDIKYVDDGRSDVYIETDYIQTWLFDYTVKHSFVEREHVSDDTIGLHTIPEGLELGEYVCKVHNTDNNLKDNHKFVIATTQMPDDLGASNSGPIVNMVGGMYGGIFTGTRYFTFDTNIGTNNRLKTVLQRITDAGDPNAVVAVFMAPKFLCVDHNGNVVTNSDIDPSEETQQYVYTEPKYYSSGFQGYVPNNKKLFTYPYMYLNVDNSSGANGIYQYEYFSGNDMTFKIQGVLTPGCSIRMVPLNYKGIEYCDREGLNLGKLPICSWATDLYTNWVTQNGVNVATQVIGGAMQTAGGIALSSSFGLGVGASTTVGGISQIANALNEVHKASMVAPQTSGNINNGDVITASNNNTFHFYHMTIKEEYARIIDKYFDMFGYKVNMVKVPNKNHRSEYWYTKTIDVNIDGAIPMKDMQVIKNAYNNGITFWRNPENIQHYGKLNPII